LRTEDGEGRQGKEAGGETGRRAADTVRRDADEKKTRGASSPSLPHPLRSPTPLAPRGESENCAGRGISPSTFDAADALASAARFSPAAPPNHAYQEGAPVPQNVPTPQPTPNAQQPLTDADRGMPHALSAATPPPCIRRRRKSTQELVVAQPTHFDGRQRSRLSGPPRPTQRKKKKEDRARLDAGSVHPRQREVYPACDAPPSHADEARDRAARSRLVSSLK
jgi:hypothetical protein